MKKFLETQQTRARKEYKALERADKNGITDAELITEMTKDMTKSNSAETIIQAAASLMYMRAVKEGETPITDATNRCLEQKRQAIKTNLTVVLN